jgi:hypothetical protein
MLGRIRDQGGVVLCDVCDAGIRDNTGVVILKKDGPPQAAVLTVHKRCESSEVVRFFYPHSYRQQPLGQFLEGILEAISV